MEFFHFFVACIACKRIALKDTDIMRFPMESKFEHSIWNRAVAQ